MGVAFGDLEMMDGPEKLSFIPFEHASWVAEKGCQENHEQGEEEGEPIPLALPLDPLLALVHH